MILGSKSTDDRWPETIKLLEWAISVYEGKWNKWIEKEIIILIYFENNNYLSIYQNYFSYFRVS